MRIGEFSRTTGVSIRALRHYDRLGLLVPTRTDAQTGYREYDESNLQRLWEILFYRELDFPLQTIREMLDAPGYDRQQAMQEQHRLLNLKKEHLEAVIAALESAMQGGEVQMSTFDSTQWEAHKKQHEEEVRQRWGQTDAYRISREKEKSRSRDSNQAVMDGMQERLSQFAQCLREGMSPEDPAVQSLVAEWQTYITENFYPCSREMLANLGLMYTADPRFTENIDRHEPGTARFLQKAIEIYCQ